MSQLGTVTTHSLVIRIGRIQLRVAVSNDTCRLVLHGYLVNQVALFVRARLLAICQDQHQRIPTPVLGSIQHVRNQDPLLKCKEPYSQGNLTGASKYPSSPIEVYEGTYMTVLRDLRTPKSSNEQDTLLLTSFIVVAFEFGGEQIFDTLRKVRFFRVIQMLSCDSVSVEGKQAMDVLLP